MDYKAKREALAEFYTEAVKNPDQPIQFNYLVGGWADESHGPDLGSDLSRWRVKKNPTKAWVWWRDNFCPVTFTTKEAAETWKREHMNNEGIIMEITKPD
jgi:hypothetical protein